MPLTIGTRLGAHHHMPASAARRAGAFAALLMMLASATGGSDSRAASATPQGAAIELGKAEPNAFGLDDMLGNVWQWCQDWFGPYPDSPVVDPQGPPTGDRHVTRGGCYYCPAIHERAARRNRDVVDHVSSNM